MSDFFGVRRQSEAATALWIATMTAPQRISWPHAPLHDLSARGTYIVTAGTYQKAHHFRTRARLEVLHRGLLSVALESGWRLEAWAVFSNHYHFVGHSPDDGADNLGQMLGLLHEKTAKWINRLDDMPGREVWHNFWETRLTHERSYLAKAKLRASESSEARPGGSGKPISVVFSWLV